MGFSRRIGNKRRLFVYNLYGIEKCERQKVRERISEILLASERNTNMKGHNVTLRFAKRSRRNDR